MCIRDRGALCVISLIGMFELYRIFKIEKEPAGVAGYIAAIVYYLNLLFGFTAPILFALLLDQLRHQKFKKFVQTASYMPYFISTVVVAGMVISFIDVDGLITNVLVHFGKMCIRDRD